MFFTREDINKIYQALLKLGIKDSELPETSDVKNDDTLAIVQDGKNKQINVREFLNQISLWKSEDFINVTDKYKKSHITLVEAIQAIPIVQRKEGLVITFLDTENNWRIYQFRGSLLQFNNETLWVDLYDFSPYIIDPILPDEEDITQSAIDEQGNTYLSLKDRTYNPSEFSGKGYKILRKNIIEIEDANFNKVKKNILTQDMINEPNTVYEIRYDFDLDSAKIIIKEGCILKFEGGSFTNGGIEGNGTIIKSNNYCFTDSCQFYGTYNCCANAKWFISHPAKISNFSLIPYYSYKIINNNILNNSNTELNTATRFANLTPSRWLNLNGLCIFYEDTLVINKENWCHITNGNIAFKPIKANTAAITYTSGNHCSIDNMHFICVNEVDKFTKVHCLFFEKSLNNTTGWYFKNITMAGFSGYGFVNCTYLQEGFFENITTTYVGGFISYNSLSLYGIDKGSSNIISIRNCSIDNGINYLSVASDIPAVVHLRQVGQICFDKVVLQGVNKDKMQKGLLVDGDSNLPLTPDITFNVWFEFTYGGNTNEIYLESPTKITFKGRKQKTFVNSDNCCIDATNILDYELLSDPCNWIEIKETIKRCALKISNNIYRGTNSYFRFNKTVNYANRGFFINLDILSAPQTQENTGLLRIQQKAYFDFFNELSKVDVSLVSNVKYEDLNGKPVCTLRNTIYYPNIKISDFRGISSQLIYRVRKVDPKLEASATIGTDKISQDLLSSTEFSPWQCRTIYIGSKKWASLGTVTLVNAELQIAKSMYYSGYMNLSDNVFLDSNNKLVYTSQNMPIINTIAKKDIKNYVGVYASCLTAIFNVEGELFKADKKGDLISLVTGEYILKNNKGTTSQRPALQPTSNGFEYYDTTLKKKILWNGTEWTNMDGTALDTPTDEWITIE